MKAFKNKDSGCLVSQDLRQFRYRLLYWLMFCVLFLLAIVIITPILWLLMSCFKNSSDFYAYPPLLFPREVRIGKLWEVWEEQKLSRFYLNSFLLATGEIAFSILFNGMCGYVLSKLKPKGSKLVFMMIFWTLMMPTTLNMIPLYMTFVNVPYINANITTSFLPLFLLAATNSFYVLLFRNFFNGIPDSYSEAAKIDGCSDVSIFFRIMLPLSKPIIMVVTIFTFNSAWSSFFWPYLLSLGNFTPLAVKLFIASSELALDKYMILMLFSIIPTSIVFCIFSEQIMGGLNMSGIKG